MWIPGPVGPDWAERGNQGFRDTTKGLPVSIETLRFNPHYREQARDLRKHLQMDNSYDLIVGTAPTSVAIYQLKQEGVLPHSIPFFAYYTSPDVTKLLATGDVHLSISNEPKLQGRIGVALTIGMLEKLPMPYQVGPTPVVLYPPQKP